MTFGLETSGLEAFDLAAFHNAVDSRKIKHFIKKKLQRILTILDEARRMN